MRSRNQRSWEITTAQPGKPSSASSSARRVSTSRSLVGSSSSSTLPPDFSTLARCTRLRSPPESSPIVCCWCGALEVEAPDVAARRGLVVADLEDVEAAGDLLPHGLLVIERVRATGPRRPASRSVPTRISPASGFSPPVSMRNRVVLPAPLGPMMPTMPPRGRMKDRPSMRSRSPKPLRRPLTSITSSPRRSPGRDVDLVGLVALLEFARGQLLVALQAGLALGLAGLRVLAHPLELVLERLAQRLALALLELQPRSFCSSHEE